MADIAKQIEEMAAAAGLAAKGQKAVCACSTCQEVVAEAEAIILRLVSEKCETFALAVGLVMWSRQGSLFEDNMGAATYDRTQDRVIDDCMGLGLGRDELQDAMVAARTSRVKPKDGPV